MYNYKTKRIFINRSRHIKKNWIDFLKNNNIKHEDNVDFTIGIYEDEELIGTGSIFFNIMKCIAVDKKHQGGAVLTKIVTALLSEISQKGYISSYVYTTPVSVDSFYHLGFKEIARIDDTLVFLEKAIFGFDEYLKKLSEFYVNKKNISAIVMNANPFTNGHKYLVDYASKRSDIVHVFVLSEDLSFFPADVRLNLVKEGTKDISNVIVHETGDYMVSAKTFPSYFLKEDEDVTKVQAKLDATVFLKIAKVLNIATRFVGEEPYSVATNIYNMAMEEVFKGSVNLTIIKRKEESKEVISASRVRELIRNKEIEKIKNLVPETTFEFLNSREFENIISKNKYKF